jgi:hypothetical protein
MPHISMPSSQARSRHKDPECSPSALIVNSVREINSCKSALYMCVARYSCKMLGLTRGVAQW